MVSDTASNQLEAFRPSSSNTFKRLLVGYTLPDIDGHFGEVWVSFNLTVRNGSELEKMSFFRTERGGPSHKENSRPLDPSTLPPDIPKRGSDWKVFAKAAWVNQWGEIVALPKSDKEQRRKETKQLVAAQGVKRPAEGPAAGATVPVTKKEKRGMILEEEVGSLLNVLDKIHDIATSFSDDEIRELFYDVQHGIGQAIILRMAPLIAAEYGLVEAPGPTLLSGIRETARRAHLKDPKEMFQYAPFVAFLRDNGPITAKVGESALRKLPIEYSPTALFALSDAVIKMHLERSI